MVQPILNSTGIVAGVCQRVSATVAQHVRTLNAVSYNLLYARARLV